MDILSSQAKLAGYKAVVDAFSYFEKGNTMMMTAANGTRCKSAYCRRWS